MAQPTCLTSTTLPMAPVVTSVSTGGVGATLAAALLMAATAELLLPEVAAVELLPEADAAEVPPRSSGHMPSAGGATRGQVRLLTGLVG